MILHIKTLYIKFTYLINDIFIFNIVNTCIYTWRIGVISYLYSIIIELIYSYVFRWSRLF